MIYEIEIYQILRHSVQIFALILGIVNSISYFLLHMRKKNAEKHAYLCINMSNLLLLREGNHF